LVKPGRIWVKTPALERGGEKKMRGKKEKNLRGEIQKKLPIEKRKNESRGCPKEKEKIAKEKL